MKYLLKVWKKYSKKEDWWRCSDGESKHKKYAKQFTFEEAKSMNMKYKNRYELIEVKG